MRWAGAWKIAKRHPLLYFCLRCRSDGINERQGGLMKEIANAKFGFGENAQRSFSRARRAFSVPRAATPEHTTVGIGSSVMILRRKVSPSILGISRSRTMTCGR